MDFDKNVFINCPFDAEYLPLLRPLLFTVIYLGLTPRIALETLDSGEPRINKISRLIEESRYSIHDVSRMKAGKKGEIARFNMPFELGLDIGCRIFQHGAARGKKCLILDKERYRYQKALSDLSNSDIKAHSNDPLEISRAVRDWLNNEAGLRAPGQALIDAAFEEFNTDNFERLTARGFSPSDIEKLEICELIGCMREWAGEHRAQGFIE